MARDPEGQCCQGRDIECSLVAGQARSPRRELERVAAVVRLVRRSDWLGVPAVLLVLGMFAWPVVSFLAKSVTDPHVGLQNFVSVATDSVYAKVLLNTVVISATTTIFTLLLGYPVAYTIARASGRRRRLMIFVVLIPFWTSLLVRTFSWMILLQPHGVINSLLLASGLIEHPLELIFNRTGLFIAMVQMQLPFLIFPLFNVLSKIDDAYMRASANLGASPFTTFWRVYFPLSMPGIVAGSMLVFVTSLGYFVTPALLGGLRDMMVAQLIDEQVADIGTWGVPAALSVILLCGTAMIFLIIKRATGATRKGARR
ncbi:ABC transporter permease [Burkholderia sp. Ax-1724]|uniref:ABC transporter permease n=1 Tax=Burkholderia sp. Ax-1724 TaxID=2608336 RepID=UPI0014233CE6|nr:ABC transporter permease [Burkholderia sp. Ax-1724]NIF51070.1 ABC transporter permease [Burkholderia sp. Ax-1724]